MKANNKMAKRSCGLRNIIRVMSQYKSCPKADRSYKTQHGRVTMCKKAFFFLGGTRSSGITKHIMYQNVRQSPVVYGTAGINWQK